MSRGEEKANPYQAPKTPTGSIEKADEKPRRIGCALLFWLFVALAAMWTAIGIFGIFFG